MALGRNPSPMSTLHPWQGAPSKLSIATKDTTDVATLKARAIQAMALYYRLGQTDAPLSGFEQSPPLPIGLTPCDRLDLAPISAFPGAIGRIAALATTARA